MNGPFQHFRLPLFTAAGRRDKPPAQFGAFTCFRGWVTLDHCLQNGLQMRREWTGHKKDEMDLQSVPRFENRLENRRENAGKKSKRLCPAVDLWLRYA